MRQPFRISYLSRVLVTGIFLTIAPFISATANDVVGPTTGMSEARLDVLKQTLDSYVAAGQLVGGVLFVSRRGEVAMHYAFGLQNREANTAMQTNSLHRIASQSKAPTSVGIMMLQEEGRLLITDPVGKYLPEYLATTVAVADETVDGGYRIEKASRPITIRDLLTHTAGISYGWGLTQAAWEEADLLGWYFAGDSEPMRDKIARIAAMPHAAQPGEKFVYGYNTDILGAVIEVISGQSLGDFLNERIFVPLGMVDTHFFVPAAKTNRLTTVYSSNKDGSVTRAPTADSADAAHFHGQGHYVNGPRQSHSGGAGLVSTAQDYGRFLEMLMAGGTRDGTRIIGRKSVELMVTNHLPDGVTYRRGAGFGLGFEVVSDTGQFGRPGSVGTFGWGGAYHSTYWVDPKEEMVVVYLTQMIPAYGLDDSAKIQALLNAAIAD